MAAMNSNWLRAAMTDDNLVAELLLRLNRPDSRPPRRSKLHPPLPPLGWGIRQPRSKSTASLKKEREVTRRSPTTPLSWTASGSASPSDSCEESSLPLDRLLSSTRLKGNATNDAPTSVSGSKRLRKKKGNATNDAPTSVSGSKRLRKKKTFAELKEEETSLLKERKHLKKELESMRIKFEEHKSFNQNLKRIKLDSHAHSVPKPIPTVNEYLKPDHNNGLEEVSASLNGPSNQQPSVFVVPDLNMTPEEDCALESVAEMS